MFGLYLRKKPFEKAQSGLTGLEALNVFPTFSIDIYLQLPIHSKRASNQYSNFALIRRAEICVKVFYNQWSLQDLKGDVFGCS